MRGDKAMKRIFALLLTVILILSLAACSGTNKTNNLANLDAELERAVAYVLLQKTTLPTWTQRLLTNNFVNF